MCGVCVCDVDRRGACMCFVLYCVGGIYCTCAEGTCALGEPYASLAYNP